MSLMSFVKGKSRWVGEHSTSQAVEHLPTGFGGSVRLRSIRGGPLDTRPDRLGGWGVPPTAGKSVFQGTGS